jgi:hypothetical protein
MPEMKGLSYEQIQELLSDDGKPKVGRPRLRHLWAGAILDALRAAGSLGLTPSELRGQTALTPEQVRAGAGYLRDTVDEDGHPPVVYVPSDHRWYLAPTWTNHARVSIHAQYLKRAATMMQSVMRLLSQSEEAFDEDYGHTIRRLIKDTERVREDTAELAEFAIANGK